MTVLPDTVSDVRVRVQVATHRFQESVARLLVHLVVLTWVAIRRVGTSGTRASEFLGEFRGVRSAIVNAANGRGVTRCGNRFIARYVLCGLTVVEFCRRHSVTRELYVVVDRVEVSVGAVRVEVLFSRGGPVSVFLGVRVSYGEVRVAPSEDVFYPEGLQERSSLYLIVRLRGNEGSACVIVIAV